MFAANQGLTVSQFVAEKCGLSLREEKEIKIKAVNKNQEQTPCGYGMYCRYFFRFTPNIWEI